MIKAIAIGILAIISIIIIVTFGKEVIVYIRCVQIGTENCSNLVISNISKLFFK